MMNELREKIHDVVAHLCGGPDEAYELADRILALLPQWMKRDGPEPVGCPTPGACSCPVATVLPKLVWRERALFIGELRIGYASEGTPDEWDGWLECGDRVICAVPETEARAAVETAVKEALGGPVMPEVPSEAVILAVFDTLRTFDRDLPIAAAESAFSAVLDALAKEQKCQTLT